MSGAISLDTSRATLPGAAVSVATLWAQGALRRSGASIAVDGRAGPATIAALETFRSSNSPDDTVRPSGEASGPSDRYPARVIIGQKTERALAVFATTTPQMPDEITPTGVQTIGPHLDPPGAFTRSSGGSWWPWLAGAAAAAVGVGAWFFLRRRGRGGSRAPKNRKSSYRAIKARRGKRGRR